MNNNTATDLNNNVIINQPQNLHNFQSKLKILSNWIKIKLIATIFNVPKYGQNEIKHAANFELKFGMTRSHQPIIYTERAVDLVTGDCNGMEEA